MGVQQSDRLVVFQPDDHMSEREQPTTIVGTARNAFLGAVVVKDDGGPVFIDGPGK